ncbi:MAG: endonuclease, partial [Nitrospinales bacterium]
KRRREKFGVDKDIIVMGDFNIPKIDDELFKAITSKGLRMPEALRGLDHGSNLDKNKRYDQILHYPVHAKTFANHGGVLDFYKGNIDKLYPGRRLGKRKFTYQLSDHLPLWAQLNTDTDDETLDQIING